MVDEVTLHPDDIHSALMSLVNQGAVFATSETNKGRVVFKIASVATPEDKEFSALWLLDPYFSVKEES